LHEFRAVAFVNKILEKGWIKDEYRHNLREILVHSIRADESLHDFNVSSKFDTHWNFLISLRDLGRIKAKEWLDENFDAIGERSTVDLHKNFLDDKNDRII
jgi:NTE family protein